MITIIHGTDIAGSRNYFLEQKRKFPDSILIDGKTANLTDLVQVFEGGELFSETKNFFIEQLFGKKKLSAVKSVSGGKSKELDQMIDYIISQEKENSIFIWEADELTKANLNKFKNPIIKLFKLPQTLFVFLESIKPGNGKTLVNLFHQTIESSDAEMVFFMMIRQIRILLGLIETTNDSIDEVKRMAPWQKGKFQTQVDAFEVDELKDFYHKLFEIEKGLKTGGLSANLVQTIDFLLLDI